MSLQRHTSENDWICLKEQIQYGVYQREISRREENQRFSKHHCEWPGKDALDLSGYRGGMECVGLFDLVLLLLTRTTNKIPLSQNRDISFGQEDNERKARSCYSNSNPKAQIPGDRLREPGY